MVAIDKDRRHPAARAPMPVPSSPGQASLLVAVRVRPLLDTEKAKQGRTDILRVMNGKVVLVLDPDESKDYLDQRANRTKEKRYTFDFAFDTKASNRDIYLGTIDHLVAGVMDGLNGTVFAYGATGSGKTYTMVGSPHDPGLMVLSLERIFQDKVEKFSSEDMDVVCSYLEVYNEVIYDLLVNNSGPLELREDPQQVVQVAGLKRVEVQTVEEIMVLLEAGNKRRKTESTDANKTSSRSHAVLEIIVRRVSRNHYQKKQTCGKLSMVDLAGSERAAETNNHGQKLRDGANINRSLLALANCINALGKQKKGRQYVPYRNSKLTRLLKDGLSGNSQTAMITTVAAASDQYHHSINTLKYADRAKEIKTHIVQNVGTVESHVSDYQRIVDSLQAEVQDLRSQLMDKASVQSSNSGDDQLSWIDTLAAEINENVEERINLQKALFELEDLNVCNKFELKQLDEYIESGQMSPHKEAGTRERRQNILESIRENEEAGLKYRADIEANEEARRSIQAKIDDRMGEPQTASFLKILSTFRLQAVRLQELQFQMAVRDQIISEQRTALSNLWTTVEAAGLGRDAVLEIAQEKGIFMEGFMPETDGPPTVGASQLTSVIKAENKKGLGVINNSMAGERAKYRYRFWANYDGSTTTEAGEEDAQSRPHSAYGGIGPRSGAGGGDEEHTTTYTPQLPEHWNSVNPTQRPQLPKHGPIHDFSSSDSDQAQLTPGSERPAAWRNGHSPLHRPPPRPAGGKIFKARAAPCDGNMKEEHGARKPDEGEFILEGAGMGSGRGGKWKDSVPGAPSEVDQKLRKLKGRLQRKLIEPNTPSTNPSSRANAGDPLLGLEVNSQGIRQMNPPRRHSDSGGPPSKTSAQEERQRERRRAQLSLLKKFSRDNEASGARN